MHLLYNTPEPLSSSTVHQNFSIEEIQREKAKVEIFLFGFSFMIRRLSFKPSMV